MLILSSTVCPARTRQASCKYHKLFFYLQENYFGCIKTNNHRTQTLQVPATFLKVPSSQIGSAWEWDHWEALPLKGHHPLYVFNFYFWSWIFERLQSSEPLHAKRPLILLFVWIKVCMCSNRDLFHRPVLQKCRIDINCSLGCGLHPSFRNPNQNRGALWRIFSSNESAPANSKTGFYADRDPYKQEVGVISAWSGSELWSLFKYSRSKIKNSKHKVVDVLLKGFPMIPLSCRSNLAGRYL